MAKDVEQVALNKCIAALTSVDTLAACRIMQYLSGRFLVGEVGAVMAAALRRDFNMTTEIFEKAKELMADVTTAAEKLPPEGK